MTSGTHQSGRPAPSSHYLCAITQQPAQSAYRVGQTGMC
jgi:hypothetical protein